MCRIFTFVIIPNNGYPSVEHNSIKLMLNLITKYITYIYIEVFLSSILTVLKIIKEAQQQHGLRHNDYQRYR